jgi:hypothetical protein
MVAIVCSQFLFIIILIHSIVYHHEISIHISYESFVGEMCLATSKTYYYKYDVLCNRVVSGSIGK